MGFFWWILLSGGWLLTWMAAVLLGGLLGGAAWAFGWGLMVYPWLSLSAVTYWLARRAATQEEADGTLFLRRCASCGRTVSEGTVICPNQACHGIDFGYQWDVHGRDVEYREREEASVAAEFNREHERRAEQHRWITLVTWRPSWAVFGWYARGVVGRGSYTTDAEQFLWWSSRLLVVGGVFAALVVNTTFGPTDSPAEGSVLEALMGWGRMLLVLTGALALSATITIKGPGSLYARLRAASRVNAGAGAAMAASAATSAERQGMH